jgi:hypothetical protein
VYKQDKHNAKILIKKLSITNVNNNIVMGKDQLKMIMENSENPSFVMNMEMRNLSKKFKCENLSEEL